MKGKGSPISPRRDLTTLETTVKNHINENPGLTTEDIFMAFPLYAPYLLTYAIRHLINDGWLNEDPKNSALTVREEPPTSEEMEEGS